MGADIDNHHFSEQDHHRFRERLSQCVSALSALLARADFGAGPMTIGAAFELFLVDGDGRPLTLSRDVADAAGNPFITPQTGAFDIAINAPPTALGGAPFSMLRDQVETLLAEAHRASRRFGARAVPIGALPTLRHDVMRADGDTNRARGGEPAPGAALRLILRVEPSRFAPLFNAVLMMTAPALAASGNSPTLLGRRLWHETRVAPSKQAGGEPADRDTRLAARVGFGNGWVRDGAAELFVESVALYPPILPICSDEDITHCLDAGGVPQLSELRLHHDTVWRWNRPIYDPSDGGHLRIEMRALPAGPTVEDMLANAGFLLGASLGLEPDVDELLPSFPFALAERNFYRAAQHGLDAILLWPMRAFAAPEPVRARELVLRLIPVAVDGLCRSGVEDDEVEHHLDVFRERVTSGQTGAVWQRALLDTLSAQGLDAEEAARVMLEHYIGGVDTGLPVHAWSAGPAS